MFNLFQNLSKDLDNIEGAPMYVTKTTYKDPMTEWNEDFRILLNGFIDVQGTIPSEDDIDDLADKADYISEIRIKRLSRDSNKETED